ncbi:myoferlin-like [Aegotheles albertisi]
MRGTAPSGAPPGGCKTRRAELNGAERGAPGTKRGERIAERRTLAWPLATCPLEATESLTLRLWCCGELEHRDLGATTVSMDRLVANPRLLLALGDVPLLNTKGQPTGVRVRVIKGHQLQGNNIKPVVRVLIGRHHFQTRIRVGNNPYYNEVFCQDFHQTPAKLVVEPIHIQVLDSQATRAKAIIGVFQLDVGTVYHAPGRRLTGKWLSLQHPERPNAGSQGYLCISLGVLRAGEPVLEQEELLGDNDDMEANLLRAPPCAATLQIRVYHAEDLPRGGLCTRVMPIDANPAWNEVFFFPLRLPPICDEIQFAIVRSPYSSKVLGTATLHLSQISTTGAELEGGTPGFLPCFGPTFLPFYGPRPDATKMPNAAYRGRVLLEISTLTTPPGKRQKDTITPEDISRVQQHHSSRCQFGLCGVFYSATMVPPGPEPLRLELSLGHYGDTSDVTRKPAASLTPHSCPLFDGNRYHYLPWDGDKPVVAVTSSWEDAGHRWDTLNLLRGVSQRLERNVAELRGARGDTRGDIGQRLLRELVEDCRQALPQLEAQPTPTPLDTHLRATRLHLLRHLAAAAAATVSPRGGWDTLLPVAEGWLGRVATLAVEPQVALPDVVLWLLQGDRRVASARVPATDLMFSRSGPGACGRLCGRIQTLFLVGPGDTHAQLRLRLWLGRVGDSGDLRQHLEGPLRVYTETYEIQTKLLGKRRLLGHPRFSDATGKAGPPPDRMRPPPGWRWDGPWTVERQRQPLLGVEASVGKVQEELNEEQSWWLSGEQGATTTATTDGGSPEGAEVWEYGTLRGTGFHLTPRAWDMRRRRRWHRCLMPKDPLALAALFLLEGSLGAEDPVEKQQQAQGSRGHPRQHPAPLILCTFQQLSSFQLRCYIYQGLELAPRATKATADPVAHVSLAHVSQSSRVLPSTLDPLWDQTLLFPRVLLHGDPRGVRDGPPAVVVEVFDQDGGRYPLEGPGGLAGELLAAFELLHDAEDGSLEQLSTPPQEQGVLRVPPTIRPRLQLVALEVLAWGLRGLRGGVRAPSLEVQCGGRSLRTPVIPDIDSNPNFPTNTFLLTLHLPEEEEFLPPVRLRVQDTRGYGYRPEVAQACVRGLGWSRCQPHGEGQRPSVPAPLHGAAAPWARIAQLLPRITAKAAADKIYDCELEAVPEFEGLQDFCQTFPLHQPGGAPGDDPPVGEFKLPPSQPQKCVVRVYIVRAFDLPPRDSNGLCDPYIRVSLGKMTLGQRDQYVPNTLEPVFGRLFELVATIPLEKDLRVSLVDYDVVPPDQEIGTTTIDLENRLLSHYRAHCGLPALYRTTGPGCWRDQVPPSQALELFARARGLPAPEFSSEGSAVTFGDQTFLLGHFERSPPVSRHHPGDARERLALHVLRGCHLVPQHLETRTLYNSTQPGLQQGKVQMWVDIFPVSLGPPGPPVDITPRKPQRYELRCVVWNAQDVDMGDTNLFGQKMSDIYVTGCLDGLEDKQQRTDIHYRSMDGTGTFNWRFVFSFEYLAAEQLCVLPRKEHFWSLDETVLKVPPKLILRLWDNDKFKGKLELSLELLTAEEAQERPAGRGRDEPNMLPAPVRSEASFLWLQAPIRTLRYALWRPYRWHLCLGLAEFNKTLVAGGQPSCATNSEMPPPASPLQ